MPNEITVQFFFDCFDCFNFKSNLVIVELTARLLKCNQFNKLCPMIWIQFIFSTCNLLLLADLGQGNPPSLVLPSNYYQASPGSHYYRLEKNVTLNHTEAQESCRKDGGNLAMPKTEQDAREMTNLIGEEPQIQDQSRSSCNSREASLVE